MLPPSRLSYSIADFGEFFVDHEQVEPVICPPINVGEGEDEVAHEWREEIWLIFWSFLG